ncbi:hypothetical protein IAT40_005208 [Kwoniella sp. CBS 6097]
MGPIAKTNRPSTNLSSPVPSNASQTGNMTSMTIRWKPSSSNDAATSRAPEASTQPIPSSKYPKPSHFPESLTGKTRTRVFHTKHGQKWRYAVEYGTDDGTIAGLEQSLSKVPDEFESAVNEASTQVNYHCFKHLLGRTTVDNDEEARIWGETVNSCQQETSMGLTEFIPMEESEVVALSRIVQRCKAEPADGPESMAFGRAPAIVVGVSPRRSTYVDCRVHLPRNQIPMETNYEDWDRTTSVARKLQEQTQEGSTLAPDALLKLSKLIAEEGSGRDPDRVIVPIEIYADQLDAADSLHKVPPVRDADPPNATEATLDDPPSHSTEVTEL